MKEGWEEKKLKDVAEYFNGLTYSPKDVSNEGIVVLRSSNVQNDELDLNDIIRVNLEVKEKIKVKDGDVLMCSRNGSARLVGKTATVKNLSEVMTFGTFMMIIRSPYNPYLAWFFKSEGFRNQIKGGENTMINQITRYMLDDISLSFPPLPEQQRIVSIIDKTLEAIDKAIENTQRNLQNAKELFESYLNNVFENGGEGWEMKKLIDICNSKSDIVGGPFGSNLKVEDYIDSGVPILRLQNIGKGYFINKGIKYISETKAEELKYHSFKSGDIALAKLGIPIGKTCIIPQNFQTGIVVADVVRIRPNFRIVRVEYLNYFLNSKYSVSQLTKNITGSTRPRVNIIDVREIDIPLPSITQQEIIVADIAKIEIQTQTIESKYQQKLRDLEELKKSVLDKAFAGEL